jgi:CubicO group peptidase (beta-lactamase class C family)
MSTNPTSIEGFCDPRFSRVKSAFETSFAERGELGAAVALYLGGVPVVDLWGGLADKTKNRPWQRDTLVNVFSTTKGLTAICAHRLVDEGRLDLDAPVATYWPEFAQAGKGAITTRMLLSHRAGLPAVREPLPPEALFDWETMTTALAKETPWWEPGTTHGYHAISFGWLVGEVIRRVSGMSPGTYLRCEIAEPLGLDLHLGLAEADDARCAELRPSRQAPSGEPSVAERIMADPTSMLAKTFINPVTLALPGTVSSRAWRGAELPAVNGHATARALAALYGALASGGSSPRASGKGDVRVLSAASIARCGEERSVGRDAVLDVSTRFGDGFMLSQSATRMGRSPRSFGHPGAGGSLAFADPDAQIGFGYVMNRMGSSILVDPRASALIDAVYASLDAENAA